MLGAYGIGMMKVGFNIADGQKDIKPDTNVVYGHPGMNIGSWSILAGYNYPYKFAISLNQNTN